MPSILGNKTRLSAPVTFPSKSTHNGPQPSIKARESYFTSNVVNEVEDEEYELPFNEENVEILMKNSGDFDQWVTEMVGDLENFTTPK